MTIRIYLAGLAMGLVTAALAQSPVRVAPVESRTLQQRQAVTGSLRAVARGDVAALESGRLIELTVREGAHVTKGEVIARIDARRLEAQKAEAEAERGVSEAELKSAEAKADRAQADLRRGNKLILQNAVSRQELDTYEANAAIAAAEIDAASRRIHRIEQTIRLLDVRLSDTLIRAPYDASVVRRHVEPGDWVSPGDPLLTLVSRGPIEAWLEVPERFARAIEQYGDSVVVRSNAVPESLHVTGTKRVADVNPRARTMSFVVSLENSDGLLSPGMSVNGWIAAGEKRDFLSVPKDAVVRRNGQAFVFSVSESSDEVTARQIPIRVLFETPHRVAVDSTQIAMGTRVVVEGNERLLPGQLVNVISSPAPRVAEVAASR